MNSEVYALLREFAEESYDLHVTVLYTPHLCIWCVSREQIIEIDTAEQHKIGSTYLLTQARIPTLLI
jgi:hypothetical protein